MTPPRVSVVIPFYNRAAFAPRCLRSVLRQKTSFAFEIVAVDNKSSDGTRDVLRRFPVRLVDCPTPGAGAARNVGVRAACGEIVAFLDSDCVAGPGWLESLVRPLIDDPSVSASGGRILGYRADRGIAFYLQASGRINQRRFFNGRGLLPPFFATANCAWRRADIERVGGFDERFAAGEDADLSWRILEDGGSMAYVHEAAVAHDHRTTFGELYRMAVGYGDGVVHAFAKHRRRMGRRANVDWMGWVATAIQPVEAVRQLLTDRRPVFNRWFVYECVWLTGFNIGKIRGSLRYGTIFV